MKKFLYIVILLFSSCCLIAQENNVVLGEENHRDVETVVGAIGGTVDVSGLGGATYTIPIQVPNGLGNIQPNLAINYNSQRDNGLLGWCWDLQGISSITREGTTRYHDGYMSGVDFFNDRFALDGQRLICLSSDYGGNESEYRTEIDGMSKIVSYTCDTTNGPAYFKVWLPNGNIAYYGNTNDSRIGLRQHGDVCIWLLNKIEDRNGNYMTYHYNKGDTKYTLATINYSGNSNANIPCNYSVHFSYSPRIDQEKTFIGNNTFDHNRILDSITIKHNSIELYKYRFEYYGTDFSNGYYYTRLNQIGFTCGNERYNPTVVNWGQNNYPVNYAVTKDITLENGGSPGFNDRIKFTGDFNGDGYTDVLLYFVDTGGDKNVSCYINKGIENDQQVFQTVDTLPLNDDIDWIYVADINGDGLDDFTLSSRNRRWLLKDILTLDTYLSTVDSQGVLSFVLATKTFDDFTIKKKYKESILIGDFLGEGKQSILVQEGEDNRSNPRLFYITFSNNQLSATELPSSMVLDVDRMFACDFNGDGISEIYYSDESTNITGLKRLKILNSVFCYENVISGILSPWHHLFIGDFNGDGKSDLLTYVENGNGEGAWDILYFKETGLAWPSYHFSNTTMGIGNPGYHGCSLKYLIEPTYEFISIGDFNGDGKSDIAVRTSGNQMRFLYAPLSRENGEARFASIQTVNLSDMGLSGASNQTICMGNFLGHENMNLFSANTLYAPALLPNRYLVSSITDGMGKISHFYYDYFMPKLSGASDSDFYKWTRQSDNEQSYDIYTVSLPIKGLRQVTTYNMDFPSRSAKVVYSYQDASIHKSGRGFLGFKKVVVENILCTTKQQTTEQVYDIVWPLSTPYLGLKTTMIRNTVGDTLSFTENSTALLRKYHPGGPFYSNIFVPIVSKQVSNYYSPDNTNELLKKEIVEYKYNDSLFTFGTLNIRLYNILKQTEVRQGTDARSTIIVTDSCEFQTIKHTDYVAETSGLIDTWVINRPSRILETKRRLGNDYDDVKSLTVYDYSTNPSANPFLPSSITFYPSGYENANEPLATRKEFSYQQTGTVSVEYRQDLLQAQPLQSTLYVYNSDGRFLKKKTNPAGYETYFEYDNDYGLLKRKTDCNGMLTIYQATPLGTSKKTTYFDETVLNEGTRWVNSTDTTAPYGACYYHWETKTGNGETRTYYDATGAKVRTVTPGLTTELIYKDFSYNEKGLLVSESLPYFGNETSTSVYWTNYQYDNYNRLIQTTHPDQFVESVVYDGPTTKHVSWIDGNFPSVTSTTTNVMGWTVESCDEDSNRVVYDYYADGALRWAKINDDESTRINLSYDAARNRTLLRDPNYGTSISMFDAYGQQTWLQTPDGNYTNYEYDILGRLIKRYENNVKQHTIDSTIWVYHSTPGLLGLLNYVSFNDNEQLVTYTYDNLNRMSLVNEMRHNLFYNTSYTYDQASRIASVTYPTGIKVNKNYTASGHLYKLSDANNNRLWETMEKNAQGQIKSYITGDNLTTYRSYIPENGRLTRILTTQGNDTVQHYLYSYDVLGNLATRTNCIHDMSENFIYDKLNRLTGIVEDNDTTGWFVYDAYGRMLSKYIHDEQVFDSAEYNADLRPHAIAQAKTRLNLPSHQMGYTPFDKLAYLEQDTMALTYGYGYEHQRLRLTETNTDGDTLRQKEYVGNCEYVVNGTNTTTLTYLSGPLGVFGVWEQDEGTRSNRYFIHPDHLGSWTLVTRNNYIQQEVCFDAWGTPYRFTSTGTEPAPSLLFDRGFTGHEHMLYFGFINMNGRMYDPFTSSFLSVDNYVQKPDFTQSFNRYAYCYNNPLKYTDPEGEFAVVDAWLSGFIQGLFSSKENRLSNAWKKANQMALNDVKIWGGLLQTDPNKGFWGRTWELFSRLTWQSPQVFTGLSWSLAKNFVGVVDRVDYLGGATFVTNEGRKKTGRQGVTLGNYVNIDMHGEINDNNFTNYVITNQLFMHEYGHYIQSQRWGLIYLFSIGLPSIISASLNKPLLNDPYNASTHDYFWTEYHANRNAAEYFNLYYGVIWNETGYPLDDYRHFNKL